MIPCSRRHAGFLLAALTFGVAALAQTALARPGSAQSSSGQTAAECAVRVAKVTESEVLQAGDLLRSWRLIDPEDARGIEAAGTLCSVFDFWRMSMEVEPRGAVELFVDRGDSSFGINLQQGKWSNLWPEPAFEGNLAALWAVAKPLRDMWSEEATEAWSSMLDAAVSRTTDAHRIWLLMERGFGLSGHGQLDEGLALLAEAHELANRGSHAWIKGHVPMIYARQLGRRDEAAGQEMAQQSADQWLASGNELSATESLITVGTNALNSGQLDIAEDALRRVERVRRRLAEGTGKHAVSIYNVGILLVNRGEIAEAIEWVKRAEVAYRELGSRHNLVQALSALAAMYGMIGESAREIDAGAEALDISRKLGAKGTALASTLINHTVVVGNSGDLATAQAFADEAIEAAGNGNDDRVLSTAHVNLGWVSEELGDLEAAARSFQNAIDVLVDVDPPGQQLVLAALSLSLVSTQLGRLDRAEQSLQVAEEALQAFDPGHYYHAPLNAAWAELLIALDRPSEALAKANLAMKSVDHSTLARGHAFAAHVARSRALMELGEIEQARAQAVETLQMVRRVSPGTFSEVRALENLGAVEHAARQPVASATAHCAGADLLEEQLPRLGRGGGGEVKFRVLYHGVFEGCAQGLLAQGKNEEAFLVLERARAWSTRKALAERGLVVGAGVEGAWSARYRRLAVEHDGVVAEFAAIEDAGDREQLEQKLSVLAGQREQLIFEAKAADPRFASIAYPEPLSVAQTVGLLANGELFVAFEVLGDATMAIVMDKSGRTRSERIPVSEEQLAGRIEAFLQSIADRDREAMLLSSESLFADLLAPLLRTRSGTNRILVAADGPLAKLPWSALGRRIDGEWRWAVEDFAITTVPSATVLGVLRQRPPVTSNRIVAFGAPAFGTDSGSDSETPSVVAPFALRSIADLAGDLAPLPGSADELGAIQTIFGAPQVEAYIGVEASETNARLINSEFRIVHFASHALLDVANPLESGLVLARPMKDELGADNGFLQAFEVLDHLRLDAELVALSACSTGRGRQLPGEGQLGLAQAFLHAGARSVLATLWPIADRASARLVSRFYRELEAGVARDEALRRAQLSLLRGESDDEATVPSQQELETTRAVGGLRPSKGAVDTSDPFFWAGFLLIGDPG